MTVLAASISVRTMFVIFSLHMLLLSDTGYYCGFTLNLSPLGSMIMHRREIIASIFESFVESFQTKPRPRTPCLQNAPICWKMTLQLRLITPYKYRPR